VRKTTTIVLAGGRSRRLGLDKIILCLDDETLLEATVKKVAALGDEVIVAVKGPLPYCLPGVRLVTDVHPGCGPLGGLHAGLAAASNSCCSVVACDMPFLNLDLLRYLISLAEDADVVVPRWTDVEPLHAIYRPVTCLGPIERALARGERRIISFYHEVRVRYVERAEIARFDPQGLSFFNVNTAEDWEQARALARSHGGASASAAALFPAPADTGRAPQTG
jgi:molybdopterin-guanine dinucleotide biosynthesis protein A